MPRLSKKHWLLVAFLAASLGVQYWAHSLSRSSSSSNPSVKKGSTAPALSLSDLDGNPVSLEQFRGQVVIVDFWATWCEPCRTEFALLKKWLEDERKSGLLDGVVTLAVNVGEERALVETYVASNPIPFRVLLDETAAVSKEYGIRALPTLLIIDRDGNVADVNVGLDLNVGTSISMWLRDENKGRRK